MIELDKIKGEIYDKYLNYASYTLLGLLVIQIIYQLLLAKTNLNEFWVWILMPLYLILTRIIISFQKNKRIYKFIIITGLLAFILSYFFIEINWLNKMFMKYIDIITLTIVGIFMFNKIHRKEGENEADDKPQNEKYFNLFYLNTSKVHEIAMLIDNKIMKTVEKEQTSEALLRNNNNINLGVGENFTTELGYTKEYGGKKRVYENFDVKTTKSIMLREVYKNAKEINSEKTEISSGDLVKFENVELNQRNIEDTVMILNVLEDSNIKNSDISEELEVNMAKMMERMLADFTIDYTFDFKNQKEDRKYIIQLSYKDAENFENGYNHSDLQLGKLNVIGIYRGEIDFSQKERISSKFLEIMSQSYQNEVQQNSDYEIKDSDTEPKDSTLPVEFEYHKLNGRYYLIDVIAIIQDIEFAGGS